MSTTSDQTGSLNAALARTGIADTAQSIADQLGGAFIWVTCCN
jgi:hypothetical protein